MKLVTFVGHCFLTYSIKRYYIYLLTSTTYNQLVTPNGEILKQKDNYDTRHGVCHYPITTTNQWSICITHSYINCTHWLIKLLSRLNADYHQWVEKSNCYGDHIRAGNDRVKKIIEDSTGLRVDQVCGPLGKGGGATDGNTGRTIYS